MNTIELVFGIVVIVLVIALVKLFSLGSKVETIQDNIRDLTAPAQTLTQITTALQNQVGSLSETVGLMSQSMTSISTQAQKIEEIGKKYKETEALTRRIHNIMIGSYKKGRTGENYLRNMMAELMKIGVVRQNATSAARSSSMASSSATARCWPSIQRSWSRSRWNGFSTRA